MRCHKPSIIIIRSPVQDASSDRGRIANLIVENGVESNHGGGMLATPIVPYLEGQSHLAVATRQRCGSDAAAMRQRCDSGAAAMRQRCGSDATAVRQRCDSGAAAMRQRCGSDHARRKDGHPASSGLLILRRSTRTRSTVVLRVRVDACQRSRTNHGRHCRHMPCIAPVSKSWARHRQTSIRHSPQKSSPG